MDGAPEEIIPAKTPAEHMMRVQQLFIKNQNSLKAFLLALVPDFAEAEDLLQEVFLVVTSKAHTFKEGTNFMAWARQIARFKAMSSMRKKRNSPNVLADDVVESLCAAEPDIPFDESQVMAARDCLKKLAPHARQLVTMRYMNEHGPGEIAERMNWSENAVNVTLSRARTFLRECVQRHMKRLEVT
jgi:RNA polymerase sigma-70 factor, ECF subfamily